jgi:cytochrome c oxidase subunit 1
VAFDERPQADCDSLSRHGFRLFRTGGAYASLIRLELLTPASDLLESATYNKVFTQHGIIMVFFFLIPSIPAILGNFLFRL